ncbi:MAG: HNH endonuclease [Deltaproteobacteria bacterium]|nr:HNH endonuclease [Deltaproteobacteria bacterium]MBW2421500.1 HNH endonuclease [Deltaproteobacteria bacterium]
MGRGATRELRRLGFKPRKSLWELDHIVPLIDGGSHDLENLQTLCTPCHVKKTSEEARLRSARAKELAALESPPPARAPRKRASRSLDELLEQADDANARAEALLARG